MAVYYVTRPSPEPVEWDSQRQRWRYAYTRFRGLQTSRDAAIRQARRVKGRAYAYDGERELIYDASDEAHAPDNVNVPEHAHASALA